MVQPFNIAPGSTRRPLSPGRASSSAPPATSPLTAAAPSVAFTLAAPPASALATQAPAASPAPAAAAGANTTPPSSLPVVTLLSVADPSSGPNSHAELDASSPRGSSPSSLGSSSSNTPAVSPKHAPHHSNSQSAQLGSRDSASLLPVLKEKEREREGKLTTFRLAPDVLAALELDLQHAPAEAEAETSYVTRTHTHTRASAFTSLCFSLSLVTAEDGSGLPLVPIPDAKSPHLANTRQALTKLEKGLFPAALEHICSALSALGAYPSHCS